MAAADGAGRAEAAAEAQWRLSAQRALWESRDEVEATHAEALNAAREGAATVQAAAAALPARLARPLRSTGRG